VASRPIWQLAVAAPSAAFARLEAERWARHGGNESAGFADQRLYHARSLTDGAHPWISEFGTSPVLVLAGPMASTGNA